MSQRETDLPSIGAFMRDGGDSARASAGVVAALVAALAADLAAQVARDSAEWSARGGALAQADVIRDRAVTLAAESAELRRVDQRPGASTGRQQGSVGIGASRSRRGAHHVVEPLLGIGEVAGDAAELAALVARSGATLVRADAVGATILATAAAEISAHLVEVNLLVSADDGHRCGRASSRQRLSEAAMPPARCHAECGKNTGAARVLSCVSELAEQQLAALLRVLRPAPTPWFDAVCEIPKNQRELQHPPETFEPTRSGPTETHAASDDPASPSATTEGC